MATPGSKSQPRALGKRVIKSTPSTRNNGAVAAVQQYFERNPDQHVWASDIMNATGFPKKTVQSAVSYLRAQEHPGTSIAVIRPGNAWRYQSPPPGRVVVPAKERVVVSTETPQPYAGVDSAIKVKVVGRFANGTLAIEINGEPYLARPA